MQPAKEKPQLSQSDLPYFNNFISSFAGDERAKYGNIRGNINNQVASILIESGLDNVRFEKEIGMLGIPQSIKDKAINLASKFFDCKIKNEVENFKSAVGGKDFQNSVSTKNLTILFERYLKREISKNVLYDLIDQAPTENRIKELAKQGLVSESIKASLISGPAKASAKIYVESMTGLFLVPTVNTAAAVAPAKPSTAAKPFKLKTSQISNHYAGLLQNGVVKVRRSSTEYVPVREPGGAVNVGYRVAEEAKILNQPCKVGVMLAANSGLPGGALGKRPDAVTEEDLRDENPGRVNLG